MAKRLERTVIVCASGTRGDVQPLALLALHLASDRFGLNSVFLVTHRAHEVRWPEGLGTRVGNDSCRFPHAHETSHACSLDAFTQAWLLTLPGAQEPQKIFKLQLVDSQPAARWHGAEAAGQHAQVG